MGLVNPPVSSGGGSAIAGSVTYATLLGMSPASYKWQTWLVQDGAIEASFYSDGTSWVRDSPIKVASIGLPFLLPYATGAAGLKFTNTTGAFTCSTIAGASNGLATFPFNCLVYVTTNANSNTPAWYYATFSNATTGQLYSQTFTPTSSPYIPVFPSSPTNATTDATTNSGYVTGTLTEQAMVYLPIPGNIIGNNGVIEVSRESMCVAGTITTFQEFIRGSGTLLYQTPVNTTDNMYSVKIQNAGSKTQQVRNRDGISSQTLGLSSLTNSFASALNTASSFNLTLSLIQTTNICQILTSGMSVYLTPGQ